MCVNDENGDPICDANGVPFGGFKPSTKLLKLKELMEAVPTGESKFTPHLLRAWGCTRTSDHRCLLLAYCFCVPSPCACSR